MESFLSEPLMLFAFQGVGGETWREDRMAAREPGPGEKEETSKKQRNPNLGDADYRPLPTVDRGHDLQITLEPDPGKTHECEAHHRRRKRLRLDAEQADERDPEDQQEHHEPNGAARAGQPREK